MKSLIVATVLAALFPAAASAQSMTCADHLKAEKQMADAAGSAKPDPESAAIDKMHRNARSARFFCDTVVNCMHRKLAG